MAHTCTMYIHGMQALYGEGTLHRSRDERTLLGMHKRLSTSGELLKAFGLAVRRLRQRAGKSQLQLADDIGGDQGNLSRLENGRLGFTPEILCNLSRSLDIPLSELFQEVEHRMSPEGLSAEAVRWARRWDQLDDAQKDKWAAALALVDDAKADDRRVQRLKQQGKALRTQIARDDNEKTGS